MDILREISIYSNKMQNSTGGEKQIISATLDSLGENMRILNDAIPALLSSLPLTQKISPSIQRTKLEKVEIVTRSGPSYVTIKAGDKSKFLDELKISEGLLRKIRKGQTEEKEIEEGFQNTRGFVKFANRMFLGTSSNLIKRGYFQSLAGEVNKANLGILLEVYVATILFSTTLALIFSILLWFILLFLQFSFAFPFISVYAGSFSSRLFGTIWIPIVIPIGTFLLLYSYPSSEKNSLAKKIDQELPFAVIHMSAIAGSGIPPIEIFKIIGMSKDYPFLRREIRKILNQINLYGYDLVTALNNVVKITPSQKLVELLSGISTTINSGGSLTEFFAKRAETLLIDYRLEREKYTKVAETFMDIYISVAIAAPMILMLVVIMMSLSGLGLPFSPGQINIIVILAIALINILFLTLLKFKQPSY